MINTKSLRLISGLLTLSAFSSGLSTPANAATYYVKSSGGNDAYTAAETVDNAAKPYKTIKKAMQQAKANFSTYGVNVIVVEPGVYPETVTVAQNGLTLKARTDATATTSARSIIRPSGPNVWNMVGVIANNVIVRGFEVDGTNAYVDGPGGTGASGAATDGIFISGYHLQYTTKEPIPAAHHVNINHCIVHDAGGGGIGSQNNTYFASTNKTFSGPLPGGCDYITIEDNIVYNNCFWSKYATSGVGFHGNSNMNTADTNSHNFIQRNRIYGNIAKYTGPDHWGNPNHTDGNGIILDTCGEQNPPTLICNNLIYNNGARGIHSFASSNIRAINNTLYKNNRDPSIVALGGGEMLAISAKNIHYANNLILGVGGSVPVFVVKAGYEYGRAGGTMENIQIRACTYWGASSGSSNIADGIIDWSTTWYSNPFFHAPDSGDFTTDVAPQQPGKTLALSQFVIDRASATIGDFAYNDCKGVARPATGKDRGAYERSLTVPSAATSAASS